MNTTSNSSTVALGALLLYFWSKIALDVLYRRLGELQSRSEYFCEDESLLSLLGTKSSLLGQPACSLVTCITEG